MKASVSVNLYVCRFNIFGEIDQTIFSNISRESFLNLPVEKVTPFLKALRLFFDTCYEPRNIVRIKLAEARFKSTVDTTTTTTTTTTVFDV